MEKNEEIIILSLGSNMGNRLLNLQNAIKSLAEKFNASVVSSSIYESKAWGFSAQTSFLNCCVYFYSSLTPLEILNKTQEIETELGRTHKSINGEYSSRTIDIDVLYIGNSVINTKRLTIPHKLLHQRNFVLVPLNEILPNWNDPQKKLTIGELLEKSEDKENVVMYVKS